jgi:hypothetical protein
LLGEFFRYHAGGGGIEGEGGNPCGLQPLGQPRIPESGGAGDEDQAFDKQDRGEGEAEKPER